MNKRLSGCRAIGLLARAVAMLALASTAHPADLTVDMTTAEPVIAPVTTHHAMRVGTSDVHYAATFGETVLSRDGKPQATISATSYVREDAGPAANRPVMFAFNGGPGASSSPLHFGSLGPKRWNERGATRQLIDNPFSLLDAADLVFVDPVGTGFGRARPEGDPMPYWSIDGDAQSVLTLIRDWLRDHQREGSPVFIAGESYGGFRLATMAKDMGDLNIAGIVLVSPLLDASATSEAQGNDLPHVFELPSLAVTAWYHEKVDRQGKTAPQWFDEAARFAQTDYLVALQQGSALRASDKQKMAARISQWVGLPASAIEAANLRVDSQKFLETLLANRKLLVGRVDTRVTAPKPTAPPPDPKRAPAADDPALGLKGSNVIKSPLLKAYFEQELGVKTSRDYLSLTLDVNFRWNWRGEGRSPNFYVNATPNFTTLLSKRPHARLLLLGGYYDLATPLLGPRYALTHAGLPPDRVTMHAFEGGHSPFEAEPQLKEMSALVHKFVAP
jgi:carboxypeptidase C (cathepsin A)